MHILLTGGGTAGHVVSNLAIAAAIQDLTEVELTYMGSKKGVEGALVREAGIPFVGVSTGKLRRYFDWQNFTDLFRIPLGMLEAWWHLGRLKPDLVFSKGGYVAVPVVFAAWLRRIPIVIHESDAIPGLATRLTARFAQRIFLGYKAAAHELGPYKAKIDVLGQPLRAELFEGSRERALQLTGFSGERPVLLVMGGSQGAEQLNRLLQEQKKELEKTYDVVHLFGPGNRKEHTEPHYFARPYLKKELRDIYALASVAVSRAGANSLAELEAWGIPTLMFPLGRKYSRGDQLANAQAMALEWEGFVLGEEARPLGEQLKNLPSPQGKQKRTQAAKHIAQALLKAS